MAQPSFPASRLWFIDGFPTLDPVIIADGEPIKIHGIVLTWDPNLLITLDFEHADGSARYMRHILRAATPHTVEIPIPWLASFGLRVVSSFADPDDLFVTIHYSETG